MIAFIDDHRGAHGVEPICKVLPIAPSAYSHVAKRRDPARLSARARQDAALKIEVRRVFDQNFGVYGMRKVRPQLKREGFDGGCCTVARLMRDIGFTKGHPRQTRQDQDQRQGRAMPQARAFDRFTTSFSSSEAFLTGSQDLPGVSAPRLTTRAVRREFSRMSSLDSEPRLWWAFFLDLPRPPRADGAVRVGRRHPARVRDEH